MGNVLLLCSILLIELVLVYKVFKNIVQPSFLLVLVFTVSSLNLFTNCFFLNISIGLNTVLIITCGCACFFIGSLLVHYIYGKKGNMHQVTSSVDTVEKGIEISNSLLFIITIINLVGCSYIIYNVYTLVVQTFNYSGSILGSLSVFATESKFGTTGIKINTISTIFSCLLEAEAYVIGYVIVKNLVKKISPSIAELVCFTSSFLSTFCQGSRSGVCILISLVLLYVFLYQKQQNLKNVMKQVFFKLLLVVCFAVFLFWISGEITGKNWNVSFYEYLSVYLGFPIYNLNHALNIGITQPEIPGLVSFDAILKKILPLINITYAPYTLTREFVYFDGHNMGNVYTIFYYLIADFGVLGMFFFMFLIGGIMQILFEHALNNKQVLSLAEVVLCYFLTTVSFSFFSNKICEVIAVFHIIEVGFAYLWIKIFEFFSKGKIKFDKCGV